MAIPDRDFGHLESSDGRMCGYVDRFGVERDMAGNALNAGERPSPGSFLNRGRVFASAVAVPHTGDTVEFTYATIALPVLGPNTIIELEADWSATNNANAKTISYYLAASQAAATGSIASNATATHKLGLKNRGVTNSQLCRPSPAAPYGASSTAMTVLSIDTSVTQNLTIRGTLGNSADTLTLESYVVRLVNL